MILWCSLFDAKVVPILPFPSFSSHLPFQLAVQECSALISFVVFTLVNHKNKLHTRLKRGELNLIYNLLNLKNKVHAYKKRGGLKVIYLHPRWVWGFSWTEVNGPSALRHSGEARFDYLVTGREIQTKARAWQIIIILLQSFGVRLLHLDQHDVRQQRWGLGWLLKQPPHPFNSCSGAGFGCLLQVFNKNEWDSRF